MPPGGERDHQAAPAHPTTPPPDAWTIVSRTTKNRGAGLGPATFFSPNPYAVLQLDEIREPEEEAVLPSESLKSFASFKKIQRVVRQARQWYANTTREPVQDLALMDDAEVVKTALMDVFPTSSTSGVRISREIALCGIE